MGNKFQDKKGHFTNKQNDGGECYHNIGTQEDDGVSFIGSEWNGKFPPSQKANNQSSSQKQTSSLTKQEWAIWYKKVADIKKLNFYADKVGKNYVVSIENDNKHKIVITGGTFENPKAKKVYSFIDSETMERFIARIRKYGKI